MQHTQRMDMVVIGAMKAATSTICAYLEDHPDIYMVPGAEPNYFSHDDNYVRGEDWYNAHLADRRDEIQCGEGSNDYAARDMYPDSAARMAAYNPDMKIVYMVRHPLDRIISAWIQNRANRGDMIPPTLDLAVQEMRARFVGQSLYWQNIEPYRAHFGDDQIFVGFMEDLKHKPVAFFESLCRFLEISPKLQAERAQVNKSAGKRIPTRRFTQVNQMPLVRNLKTVLPKGVKALVKDRLLSQSVATKPAFSAAVHAELVTELRADSAAFLAHYGKPADFWVFD